MDVIVLDGNQRASLAITRSLGSRGIKVIVGEYNDASLASKSRYCAGSFSYPNPFDGSGPFLEKVMEVTSGSNPVLVIPVTDVTVSELLRNRGFFHGNVVLPFVDFEKYSRASDKISLFRRAEQMGIPVPKTIYPDLVQSGVDTVLDGAGFPGFPVVVKPARSRDFLNGRWVETAVRYAGDAKELNMILHAIGANGVRCLVQERIEGPGIGIFLLMRHGKVLARFAHHRIREKPPSGGVSVLCEGIEPPGDALEAATTLLRDMDWTGVAMVEFKRDRRGGIHKLIEVNARFWGSLQLAISSGVDFPYLLYRMARGDIANGPDSYRVGLRSRWELGDLDHLLLRMRKTDAELRLPKDAPSRGATLVRFLSDFLRPSIRGEVMRPDDPGPFCFELKQYCRHITGRS